MAFDVNQYVKKIVASKPAGTGNYIRDGEFTLALKSLQIKPSDKGGEVWFIGEFMVLASKAVEVPPDRILDKPITPPNAVGSDCSMSVDLNSQMGPSNVKELACADLNLKFDQLTEDQLSLWMAQNVDVPGGNPNWVGKTAQPLKGRAFEAKTVRKMIKGGPNAGKALIKVNFGHVVQTAAELSEMRGLIK